MHLYYRNVNDAFRGIVKGIYLGTGEYGMPGYGDLTIPTVRRPSRNGDVLMIEEPVTITYSEPKERVLFNQARDANPFFHVYESLWMLAGRNDVAPLAYYNKRMADYSDDGKKFNGAYGYRWRHSAFVDFTDNPSPGDVPWNEADQLKILIDHLKAKPESRRAVLQMWNVEDDLLKIDSSKDVCCNLSALFSLREYVRPISFEEANDEIDTPGYGPTRLFPDKFLDMTVFNRSNDLIWGALGANVVHFSFLQEYVAASLGVEVGVYNQISNNLHVYVNNFEPEKWLADKTGCLYTGNTKCAYCSGTGRRVEDDPPHSSWDCPACGGAGVVPRTDYPTLDNDPTLLKTIPLVKNPGIFDKEVVEFVERHSRDSLTIHYEEPFLNRVAQPMMVAFHHHKRRQYDYALEAARTIKADDWRIASVNWLTKRKETWENKNKPGQVTDGKDL